MKKMGIEKKKPEENKILEKSPQKDIDKKTYKKEDERKTSQEKEKKINEKKVVINVNKEKSPQKEIDNKSTKKEEEKKTSQEKERKIKKDEEKSKPPTTTKEEKKTLLSIDKDKEKKVPITKEEKTTSQEKDKNKEKEKQIQKEDNKKILPAGKSKEKLVISTPNTKNEESLSARSSQKDLNKDIPLDKRKKDKSKKIEKIELSDSEIIEKPEDIISVKRPNQTFARSKLLEKISEMKAQISEHILQGIMKGMELAEKNAFKEIKEGILKFSLESKSVDQIIALKFKKSAEIEEMIRLQKIKDLQENQEHLKDKLFQVNENKKVLESEGYFNLSQIELNSSLSLIDNNVRLSQIREFKETKEFLTQRMIEINNQIQKLMTDEEQNELAKKINIKQFLENFERDKEIALSRANRYREESKQREEKMKADIVRVTKRRLKEYEKTEKEKEKTRRQKLEEIHLKEVELLKKIATKNEAALNLSKLQTYNNPDKENECLFQIKEKEFNIKRENEAKEELMKYKSKVRAKLVTKEEIDEFTQQRKEEFQRREAEKEEDRQRLQELWKSTNENLPKFESQIRQILQEEDKKEKEEQEYQNLKSKIKLRETQDYSETVVKLHLPRINPKKKKEIENRVNRLKYRPKIPRHRRKHQRILLKKSDPIKMKRKFKWKLKLKKKNTNTESDKSLSLSLTNRNRSLGRRSKSRSERKRKPLDKLPDYLTQMRLRKEILHMTSNSTGPVVDRHKTEKKWQKMIMNSQNSLLENVEQIKIGAQILEEKAKWKEKFLKHNGGTEKNPEICEDVSNMLIAAIKAKLTILGKIIIRYSSMKAASSKKTTSSQENDIVFLPPETYNSQIDYKVETHTKTVSNTASSLTVSSKKSGTVSSDHPKYRTCSSLNVAFNGREVRKRPTFSTMLTSYLRSNSVICDGLSEDNTPPKKKEKDIDDNLI